MVACNGGGGGLKQRWHERLSERWQEAVTVASRRPRASGGQRSLKLGGEDGGSAVRTASSTTPSDGQRWRGGELGA